MKKLYFIILVLFVAIWFASCSSGKRDLKRGDYYQATISAVNRLRTSPNNKKSQNVLIQAYALAKEKSLRKIQNAKDANSSYKYSIMADEYIMLNEMAEVIFTCPKALELIKQPQQFNKELGTILPLAAEEAYNMGDQLLKRNTIVDAREAYFQFMRADRYVQGYRDVNKKIGEALFVATLKVVVQKPYTSLKYQYTADFFYNNLMSQISRMSKNKFIRFYTYEEAKNENLTYPDQYLVLNFEDFSVGNIRESKKTIDVSRDSVLIGTTNVNGVQQSVYGTVKAKFTTFKREVISQGVLSAQIINAANGRIEEYKNFPGNYIWVNEWASYKGDERALTNEQKKKSNIEPSMPPSQQDLFIEFTKPIFDQTVSFVKNYYNRHNP